MRRRLADPSFDVLSYQSQNLPQRPPGCWAGNRLLVHQDKRFAWDRHGNLIAKKTGSHKAQYFAYDAQGQLTHVLTRTGLTSATAREQLVAFAYDALGRRVAKRVWPAQALRNQQPDEPHQGKHSLPPPSFVPPKGAQPSTSAYLWEGNRLLQEITSTTASGDQRRTYVFEPDSFIPMLRIDEAQSGEALQKQEQPAQAVKALEAKNHSDFDDEDEPDNFAALKAQAWGRMVPGQISQHLSELRAQAETLRLPEKASQPMDARILHYHCDHLGTPRELTDEDGKLVWSAEYLAWGKLKRLQGRAGESAGTDKHNAPPDQFWHTRTQPGRASHLPEWVADNTGNVQKWREEQEAELPEATISAANDPSVWGALTDQSIRFQGQWHDVETGLHYNRFRYYDPEVGRFIHQDPIGLVGGYNLYQYAPNPFDWIDSFGLSCWTAAKKEYWKEKAKKELLNPTGKYSPSNIARMRAGDPPKFRALIRMKNGDEVEKDISIELHHTYLPQRCGSKKAHEAWNLTEVTPWGHAAMDKYRYPQGDLVKIIKGTNSF